MAQMLQHPCLKCDHTIAVIILTKATSHFPPETRPLALLLLFVTVHVDVTDALYRVYVCCKGVLLRKSSIYTGCCGTRSYDIRSHICCCGPIWKKTSTSMGCCGRYLCNWRTQKCCYGRTLNKSTPCRPLLCQGRPYNPLKQKCCYGLIQSKYSLCIPR